MSESPLTNGDRLDEKEIEISLTDIINSRWSNFLFVSLNFDNFFHFSATRATGEMQVGPVKD